MTRRLLAGLTSSNNQQTSWSIPATGVELLRANNALGSIETDVFMEKKDDAEITATAKLLLRGVERSRWAQ